MVPGIELGLLLEEALEGKAPLLQQLDLGLAVFHQLFLKIKNQVFRHLFVVASFQILWDHQLLTWTRVYSGALLDPRNPGSLWC